LRVDVTLWLSDLILAAKLVRVKDFSRASSFIKRKNIESMKTTFFISCLATAAFGLNLEYSEAAIEQILS
jgi:hypothetical protein